MKPRGLLPIQAVTATGGCFTGKDTARVLCMTHEIITGNETQAGGGGHCVMIDAAKLVMCKQKDELVTSAVNSMH